MSYFGFGRESRSFAETRFSVLDRFREPFDWTTGPDFRREVAKENETAEKKEKPRENEIKYLEVDGTKLRQSLESKNHLRVFEGRLTDYYFELTGPRAAREVFGDWPRIRHKQGVVRKKVEKDGVIIEEELVVDEFEITIKGVRSKDKNAEDRAEDNDAGVFRVADFSSPSEAYEAALAKMGSYLAEKFKIDPAEITQWGELTKHRTSYMSPDGVRSDIDAWDRKITTVQQDMVLPEDIQVLDSRGNVKTLKAGTKLKKGQKITVDLSAIPEYLELEILYLEGDDASKARGEKRRQKLEDELIAEGALQSDPSKKIHGTVGTIFGIYNIPDYGKRPDSIAE